MPPVHVRPYVRIVVPQPAPHLAWMRRDSPPPPPPRPDYNPRHATLGPPPPRGVNARRYPGLALGALFLTATATGLAFAVADRPATSVLAAPAAAVDQGPLGAGPAAHLRGGAEQREAPAVAALSAAPGAAGPRARPLAGAGGLCADGRDAAGVRLRACDGGPAQQWVLAADGTLRLGDRCLQPVAGRLRLQRCTAAPVQRWTAAPPAALVNAASGQCLTAPARRDQPVRTARCTHVPTQRWTRR